MWRKLLWVVTLAAAAVSLAGMLTPLLPLADFANHVRPYLLIASVLWAGVIFSHTGQRAARLACLGLITWNAIFITIPLMWSSTSAAQRGAAQATNERSRSLKLITFNMAWAARPLGNVIAFLISEDADIVALQEATSEHGEVVRKALGSRYPHILSCHLVQGCTQMLLSKRPWVEAHHIVRANGGPEMIWARFDDPALGPFRLHSLHLAWPFTPEKQARHVDHLLAMRKTIGEPAIFVGDFNLTPWSYHLNRLLIGADLRRHTTWQRSWPTDGQMRLPWPLMLIDHVLSTPHFSTVSVRTGANAGSDHLPIVAVLAFDRP